MAGFDGMRGSGIRVVGTFDPYHAGRAELVVLAVQMSTLITGILTLSFSALCFAISLSVSSTLSWAFLMTAKQAAFLTGVLLATSEVAYLFHLAQVVGLARRRAQA